MLETADIVFLVLFILIIVLGLAENMAVVYKTWRYQDNHTTTGMMVSNVAVSHILFCALDLPLQLYEQLHHTWVLGTHMCRLRDVISQLVIHVPFETLAVLSIMRVIEQRQNRAIESSIRHLAIAIIWFVSTVLSMLSVFTDHCTAPASTACPAERYDMNTLNTTATNSTSCCIQNWKDTIEMVPTIPNIAFQLALPTVTFLLASTIFGLGLRSRFRDTRACDDYKEKAKHIEQIAIGNRKMRAIFWLTLYCVLPAYVLGTMGRFGTGAPAIDHLSYPIVHVLLACMVLVTPVCWLWVAFSNDCTERVVYRLRCVWCGLDCINDMLEGCPDDEDLPV